MKAVDTNVLARFFIDDPEDNEAALQKPAAIQAMSQAVFVSISVILEFEWVMRGFYALPRADIVRVFKALCGLQHVTIEDRAIILAVIEAFHQGLDFADALHLARAQHCKAFVSFDKRLQKRAKIAGLQPVVEILK
jgi:predicted nucleic-acid-binding protein